MATLTLAEDLSLPLDVVTAVTLIAGKRGSGKTNTAKRLIEQVIRAGVPVAILDPADVWWGLRAGRDGRATGGLPVHVFGGRHQDLPLEATAGALLADVVVDQRVSVVMAIREFSNAERARFVTDFAERLIRRNTEPLLVTLEEAHEVMPQSPQREDARSLAAMLRIVTLGRSSGLGVVQVTQRLAKLNKTATTQSDVLVAHRTIGPQDQAALEEWIKYHHAGAHRAAFMERLPALKTGHAWLWAPDFPEDAPYGLREVAVLACETFNSHQTPKVGERRAREPKALATVDLERLRTQMAATIERAKQEDPRELRKALASLRAELATAQRERLTPASAAPVETQALTDADRALLEKIAGTITDAASLMHEDLVLAHQRFRTEFETLSGGYRDAVEAAAGKAAQALQARLDQVRVRHLLGRLAERAPSGAAIGAPSPVTGAARPATLAVPRRLRPEVVAAANGDLSGPEQRLLDAIAWLAAIGVSEPEQPAVAFLAGYTYNAGSFNNPKGRLRTRGYVEYLAGRRIRLTEAGRRLATPQDAPLTVDELHRRVLAVLPTPEQRLLQPLLAAWPQAMANADLAAAAGYAPNSGGFNNPRGHLRSLGLVDYPQPGQVRARDLLFPAGGE